MRHSDALRFSISVVIGIAAWFALSFIGNQGVIPSPTTIIRFLPEVFGETIFHGRFTFATAATAMAIALSIAWFLATIASFQRAMHPYFREFFLVAYMSPIVAIGPIVSALYAPGISATVIAVITILYPCYQLFSDRMRDSMSFRAPFGSLYSSNSITHFRLLVMPTTIPTIAVAARFALPWAVLGSMLGEYLGARNGLGVYLLGSMSRGEPGRIWAICIILIAVVGILTLILAIIERIANSRFVDSESSENTTLQIERIVGTSRISPILLLLVAWLLIYELSSSKIIIQGPINTAAAVFSDLDRTSSLMTDSIQTVLVSMLGLFCALGIALIWALTSKGTYGRFALNSLLMPLQLIPIIVAIPILYTLFGRSVLVTVVVCVLATIFPIYTNARSHLNQVPSSLRVLPDLYRASVIRRAVSIDAYWLVLGSIRGLRAAAPRAVLGVMLSEALITGQGLGWAIYSARGYQAYDVIWLVLVLIVLISIIFDVGIARIEANVTKWLN